MTRRPVRCMVLLAACLCTPRLSAQDLSARTPHRDSYWYGQFGVGSIADGTRYLNQLFAFGHRRERGALALDVKLFTGQRKSFGTHPDLHTYGGIYTTAYAGSLMTVQVFRVLQPNAGASAYLGAGAGLGGLWFGRSGDIDDEWHGRGAEGHATLGYAFRRADTSTRWFVEGGLAVPFYAVQRSTRLGGQPATRRVYPLTIALGVGW